MHCVINYNKYHSKLESKLMALEEKEMELKQEIANLAQHLYSKKAQSIETKDGSSDLDESMFNTTSRKKALKQERIRKKMATTPIPLQYRNFLAERAAMATPKDVVKTDDYTEVKEITIAQEVTRSHLFQSNIPAEMKKLERFLETLQLQRLLPKFEVNFLLLWIS
jgi:hypothetical protein